MQSSQALFALYEANNTALSSCCSADLVSDFIYPINQNLIVYFACCISRCEDSTLKITSLSWKPTRWKPIFELSVAHLTALASDCEAYHSPFQIIHEEYNAVLFEVMQVHTINLGDTAPISPSYTKASRRCWQHVEDTRRGIRDLLCHLDGSTRRS